MVFLDNMKSKQNRVYFAKIRAYWQPLKTYNLRNKRQRYTIYEEVVMSDRTTEAELLKTFSDSIGLGNLHIVFDLRVVERLELGNRVSKCKIKGIRNYED